LSSGAGSRGGSGGEGDGGSLKKVKRKVRKGHKTRKGGFERAKESVVLLQRDVFASEYWE